MSTIPPRYAVALILSAGVGVPCAHAQTARQATTTAAPYDIQITHKGTEATPHFTVKSTNAPIRDILRDIAARAGVKVMFSPSAGGIVTGEVRDRAVDEAIADIAGLAGMSLRVIHLPGGTTANMTPEDVARAVDVLASLPMQARVDDPATGRSLTLASLPSMATASSDDIIYYVQGKLTPQQERAAPTARVAGRAEEPRPGVAPAPGDTRENPAVPRGPVQSLVGKTVQDYKSLPLDMKMQMMRSLQREMRGALTSDERQQLRLMEQQRRQQNPNNSRDRRRR